ncbi:MAG: UvrD-helicase domain-containing protein [Pseudomonadota bacterium]
MSETLPPDHAVRLEGVDGRRSYIVQAPAGSGKTELLVQRFLRLLGEVHQPEAIVAITFTRKAASEMRNRIVDAMTLAETSPRPAQGHRARTWDLASRALHADRERNWRLRRAPRRLRVQTIDSLCSDLVRQLPLLSRMGADAEVVDDAERFYRTAAEQALDLNAEDTGDLAATVLMHVDGNLRRAIDLMADLLARRDQWLPYLGASTDPPMQRLEQSMALLVGNEARVARAELDDDLIAELFVTAQRAIANLASAGRTTGSMEATAAMRAPQCDSPAMWGALGQLFLTKDGAPRKSANKNVGVPTVKSVPEGEREAAEQLKKDFTSLLDVLSDNAVAAQALLRLRELPDPHYAEDERNTLSALLKLLPRALAHLHVEFGEAGVTDFAEIQLRAIAGLGHPDAPSDLALALDHRIEHLLVDEFQDTSNPQVELLSRLTAGWQPDDGRTLFIVGDPMQSIYRFRKAEVGNFLRVRSFGIHPVPLQPLELTANFRSQADIVEWVNATFERLLPARDDATLGRISYAPSVAVNPAQAGVAVTVHALAADNANAQAEVEVAAIVETLEAARAGGLKADDTDPPTIAILVRARSHLLRILPALRRADIAFQAVELDKLNERQIVLDLHALTRLLVTPDDKTAWLAALRAPWCGLQLPDLHALFGDDSRDWLALMYAEAPAAGLSTDGLARLHQWQTALRPALDQWRRRSLATIVESLWTTLGGPDLAQPEELVDARTYLDLLRAEELGATVTDLQRFAQRLDRQFASSSSQAGSPVQVMTMHKAKGLEFDIVLLPGLGRRPSNADRQLLAWQERAAHDVDGQLVETSLVMAPISNHQADSGLYGLIRTAESALDLEEQRRLLYVAATRARQRLHLFGTVGWDTESAIPKAPPKNSLLHLLWPVIEPAYANIKPCDTPQAADAATEPPLLLRRQRDSTEDLASPASDAAPTDGADAGDARDIAVPRRGNGNDETVDLEFDWAGETARHTGTLVHRWLERIVEDGLDNWALGDIDDIAASFSAALRNLGVLPDALEEASERVAAALKNALTDARGRWLLQPHAESHAELALTASARGMTSGYVVDRTFVDADGTRWIVDYKTGVHEGGDVSAFLDNEQERYRAQLEGYARLLATFEQRPTRLALYFPVLGAFRDWAF